MTVETTVNENVTTFRFEGQKGKTANAKIVGPDPEDRFDKTTTMNFELTGMGLSADQQAQISKVFPGADVKNTGGVGADRVSFTLAQDDMKPVEVYRQIEKMGEISGLEGFSTELSAAYRKTPDYQKAMATEALALLTATDHVFGASGKIQMSGSDLKVRIPETPTITSAARGAERGGRS